MTDTNANANVTEEVANATQEIMDALDKLSRASGVEMAIIIEQFNEWKEIIPYAEEDSANVALFYYEQYNQFIWD